MRQKGASHLLLVLIIMMVLTLIAFSLQLFAFIEAKTAAKTAFTNQTFFAAEGALYETIQHMRNDPGWPDNYPDNYSYNIGETRIDRNIDINAAGEIAITIKANTKGVRRELVATYGKVAESEGILDIALVIDTSGSMDFHPPDSPGATNLKRAKQAAKTFLDVIESANKSHRVGLISYSDSASKQQDLTDSLNLVRLSVNNLDSYGGTNIADAFYTAKNMLDTQGRPDARKVIILLSDGVPNHSRGEICLVEFGFSGCPNNACINPSSGYAPDNEGWCCSDNTIEEATNAKEDYIIINIALIPDPSGADSACSNIASTARLGRLTLLRSSSEPGDQKLPGEGGDDFRYYYETDDPDRLEDIYKSIASEITAPAFFSIEEVAPNP